MGAPGPARRIKERILIVRIPTYAGRRGRRLRPGRRKLINELLPRLRLDVAHGPVKTTDIFSRPMRQIWLEIGFGAGEHLVGQARCHPDIGFIGCEPFLGGVGRVLSQIKTEGLDNIRLLDGDARDLFDVLEEACLNRVFLLFPDPWPKARHAKRRFVCAETIDGLARLCVDGAELRIASDDLDYMTWSLSHLSPHPAFDRIGGDNADWHRPPTDHLPTRYQKKAMARDIPCMFLRFERRARDLRNDA